MIGLFVAAQWVAALVSSPATVSAPPPVLIPPPPMAPANQNRAKLIAGSISDADYPLEAWQAGESGTTTVNFDVSPQGLVTACRIRQSSGSTRLDRHTCSLIIERFRYEPPRDARGKATSEIKTQRVIWRLPQAGGPNMLISQLINAAFDVEVLVAPDGSVKGCTLHQLEAPRGPHSDPCPMITRAGGFKPFPGTRNKRLRFRMSTEVTDE